MSVYISTNVYITKKGIKKPVVILSDGQSSQFNAGVMEFLRGRISTCLLVFLIPLESTKVSILNTDHRGKIYSQKMEQ